MPKLEISKRIYARPTLYYDGVEKYFKGLKISNKTYSAIIYGDQFNWTTGFYISSDEYFDKSLLTWVNPFSSYTNQDILSSFPPFSGYSLDFSIIDNNEARVTFNNLSSFNNIKLIVVNPAGYSIKTLFPHQISNEIYLLDSDSNYLLDSNNNYLLI